MEFEEIRQHVDSVSGWMLEGQPRFLFDKVKSLPDGAVIVEMGANRGKSTCAMAFACVGTRKRIISIDAFRESEDPATESLGEDFYHEWLGNLKRFGLESYATGVRGYTHDVLAKWSEYPQADFVFIDASHEYIDVMLDFEMIYPYVKTGGWIAFHDVEPGWPGSWRVWLEAAAPSLVDHQFSTTLACGRKTSDRIVRLQENGAYGFSFSRLWAKQLLLENPQHLPLTRAMEASLAWNPETDPNLTQILAADKLLSQMPAPMRATLRAMLSKDAKIDGQLHLWYGLTLLAEDKLEEALGEFQEAARASFCVPAKRVESYCLVVLDELRKRGKLSPERDSAAPGAAWKGGSYLGKVDQNALGYYNADYYAYQKEIGAFGGMANLFKFQPFLKDTDRVVDFGSGGGFLLRNVKAAAKVGVEINKFARKEASNIRGIESVEKPELLPEGWADVIISNHALEHVHAPLDALKALYPKLKAGGAIVFVVPHHGPHEQFAPEDLHRHLYTWNPLTLGNLFAEAGYQVEKAEAIQHTWPPNYVELWDALGEEGFHKACREHAVRNNIFQIRVVARKPAAIAAGKPGMGNPVSQASAIAAASVSVGRKDASAAAEIPVVLITYKRPEHTAQVLRALREHGVKQLHIYSDAPRTPADKAGVDETRRLIQGIDWVQPNVVMKGANRGLARSIMGAVDDVFEDQDRMILLEDDCVPQRHFFGFMGECLDRYAAQPEVFGVSGYTVPLGDALVARLPYDLYFAPRIGSWGWATWKRAWKLLDRDLDGLYKKIRSAGIDIHQGGNDIEQMVISILKGNPLDAWTLNWVLTCYLNRGQFIYPTISHIRNIGMDGTGVHCGATAKFDTPIATSAPTRFPERVQSDASILARFRGFYDIG